MRGGLQKTTGRIATLGILSGLWALSVLVYRWRGIVFDSGLFSYGVFSIIVPLGVLSYIVYGLLRDSGKIREVVRIVSLSRFIERIIIQFWSGTMVRGLMGGKQ